jgi:lipopolysaccharide transport system ATP-binding protein
MPDTVIRVENLSKKYVLSHQQEGGAYRYKSLRDTLTNSTKGLFTRFGNSGKTFNSSQEEFWALRDVNFEIKQGDRVGIIGRNGAGKSTLLKVLSRIVEPTSGSIRIKGRVASLLEVGTGFHPELTGRENIFLNGAILGMSKAEIQRKFDEIVDFAEIEKFLDTPVKRYSSGMYVRLAFAVAAHLEPEILIVDEVLAVGDAQFQKKCLGKMQDVGKEGRTVLFVSHNMGAISTLCNRGVYLNRGQVDYVGSIEESIEHYFSSSQDHKNQTPGIIFQQDLSKTKKGEFQVIKIALLDEGKALKTTLKTWDYLRIRIHYNSPRPISRGSVEIQISTHLGSKLFQYSTEPLSGFKLEFSEGENYVDCILPKFPLSAGKYMISAGLAVPMIEWLCWHEEIATLEVLEKDVYGSKVPPNLERSPIAIEHYWEVG